MKRLLMVLIVSLLFASSAFAFPWDSLDSDWTVSGSMDYWTVTDLTTGENGNGLFQIVLENAAYESAFGLYTIGDDGSVDKKFEVFGPEENPASTIADSTSVSFWNNGGSWQITKSYSDDSDDTNDGWVEFSSQFGFYYDVDQNYNSGGGVSGLDYTFFTDNTLNTAEENVEHIMTAYNANNKWLYVYLDDQIGAGRDNDYTDMTVFATDVSPVPEPATLLLLGSGLVGLAFLKRRKS